MNVAKSAGAAAGGGGRVGASGVGGDAVWSGIKQFNATNEISTN